ncbi:hypothetical protein E2I00_018707 [Balaenoptera physalus]|uniref:Uncharacterized protein n=2 Tax=Amniota TaxID=32524 RepID=A0A6A1QG50_BALPH|nr:hypothetical protein E2I00_018707 [Balaenoptera physalus]
MSECIQISFAVCRIGIYTESSQSTVVDNQLVVARSGRISTNIIVGKEEMCRGLQPNESTFLSLFLPCIIVTQANGSAVEAHRISCSVSFTLPPTRGQAHAKFIKGNIFLYTEEKVCCYLNVLEEEDEQIKVQRLYEAETGSRICLEPDALGNEPSDNFFFNFRIRRPVSSRYYILHHLSPLAKGHLLLLFYWKCSQVSKDHFPGYQRIYFTTFDVVPLQHVLDGLINLSAGAGVGTVDLTKAGRIPPHSRNIERNFGRNSEFEEKDKYVNSDQVAGKYIQLKTINHLGYMLHLSCVSGRKSNGKKGLAKSLHVHIDHLFDMDFHTAQFIYCFRALCCKGPPPARPEYDLVCIGLTGSGKTSLLSKLCSESPDSVVSTTGFSIKAVPFQNAILNVKELGGRRFLNFVSLQHFYYQILELSLNMDLGYTSVISRFLMAAGSVGHQDRMLAEKFLAELGADNIRKYWSRYYQGSQGVIFVLDSASSEDDLETARNELHSALQHPQLCTLPFLILANHQDKPAARSVQEVCLIKATALCLSCLLTFAAMLELEKILVIGDMLVLQHET